jgi:hypothetical protein
VRSPDDDSYASEGSGATPYTLVEHDCVLSSGSSLPFLLFFVLSVAVGTFSYLRSLTVGVASMSLFDRRKREGYTPEKSWSGKKERGKEEESVGFLNQRSSMMGEGDVEMV